MEGSVGHDTSCGEKENGHPTSRIMCILQHLSLWSSQRQHSSPRLLYRTVCEPRSYTKVTVRRPRRLRKRHPTPYKNKPIPSNVRLDVLSERLDKEICAWDSCSTIEPVIQICNQKEDLKSLELTNNSDELDSVLPELIIGGTCYGNCGYAFLPSVNKLSTFVPHVLETIEEADVETREQVGGF